METIARLITGGSSLLMADWSEGVVEGGEDCSLTVAGKENFGVLPVCCVTDDITAESSDITDESRRFASFEVWFFSSSDCKIALALTLWCMKPGFFGRTLGF